MSKLFSFLHREIRENPELFPLSAAVLFWAVALVSEIFGGPIISATTAIAIMLVVVATIISVVKAIVKRQLNKDTYFLGALSLGCILFYCISMLISVPFDSILFYLKKISLSSGTVILLFFFYNRLISKQWLLLAKCLLAICGIAFLTKYCISSFGITKNVTLGLSNSNLTGMYSVSFGLAAFSLFLENKQNIFLRMLWLAESISLFFLVLFTSSRGSMLGFVSGVFLYFLFSATHFSNFCRYNIGIVLACFPIMVFVVYLLLFYSDFSFGGLSITGKGFFSREVIWDTAMSRFVKKPFFGDFLYFNEALGYSQLHNAFLDILGNYGLVGFLLFSLLVVLFWLRKIPTFTKGNTSSVLFFGLYFLGLFEAGFFSCSAETIILFGMACQSDGRSSVFQEQRNGFPVLSINI